MTEKLTDPNKPAHEIIEVLEDGGAIRNDGVRLGAANKNPWYVLATVFGEQAADAVPWDYNKELAAKNRRAWNGWFCGGLSEEERKDRAGKAKLTVDDLAPLTETELTEIRNLFAARMQAAGIENAELPDPAENILFSQVNFLKFLNLEKFVVEKSFDFSKSHCSGFAYFSSATFTGFAYFSSATFTGDAYFRSATFTGSAYFSSAIFEQQAIFSSAKFKFTTDFKNAKFITHVPEFHAAELYEDTEFTLPDDYLENWPPLKGEVTIDTKKYIQVEVLDDQGNSKDPVEKETKIPLEAVDAIENVVVMPADKQKKAYNRLRLYMNKSLQTDEEQFFHRMEMRCKREIEKSRRMRLLYDLFEGVSDFGSSVLRPAGWLFVVWLSGMIAKLEAVQGEWYPDWHSVPSAMGWSFANMFSFFGFHKRYFGEEELNAVLQMTGGVQTVLGFILLFFLGLGLRNRFRLR